jgi:carbonic anhydrase
MAELLSKSLTTAELTPQGFRDAGTGPGSHEGKFVKWHCISNAQAAVVDDVARIRRHELVPAAIPIYGYLFDVTTGALREVPEATQVGRAS